MTFKFKQSEEPEPLQQETVFKTRKMFNINGSKQCGLKSRLTLTDGVASETSVIGAVILVAVSAERTAGHGRVAEGSQVVLLRQKQTNKVHIRV